MSICFTLFKLIVTGWVSKLQSLVGALQKYQAHQQGRFHDNPASRNQPIKELPISTITLKELQGRNLMNPILTVGWVGLDAKLTKETTEAVIHKDPLSKQLLLWQPKQWPIQDIWTIPFILINIKNKQFESPSGIEFLSC